MPKYIDADEYIKYCEENWIALNVDAVNKQPEADVVSIVRCKDCKYKPTAPDGITYGLQVEFPDKWCNLCPCLCEDGWHSWVPDDNFFCGYGAKE